MNSQSRLDESARELSKRPSRRPNYRAIPSIAKSIRPCTTGQTRLGQPWTNQTALGGGGLLSLGCGQKQCTSPQTHGCRNPLYVPEWRTQYGSG